jgi:hypothetical protein
VASICRAQRKRCLLSQRGIGLPGCPPGCQAAWGCNIGMVARIQFSAHAAKYTRAQRRSKALLQGPSKVLHCKSAVHWVNATVASYLAVLYIQPDLNALWQVEAGTSGGPNGAGNGSHKTNDRAVHREGSGIETSGGMRTAPGKGSTTDG